jgi:hypothetical protein
MTQVHVLPADFFRQFVTELVDESPLLAVLLLPGFAVHVQQGLDV